MTAETLLSRLEKVSSRGGHNWMALCPAHEDRGPSLSIREASDGTVLIKCFAGCTAAEVVGAVDLELSDLFPAQLPAGIYSRRPRHIPQVPCWDMVRALRHALSVVLLTADQLKRGEPLSPEDHGTLLDAVTTIEWTAKEAAHVPTR